MRTPSSRPRTPGSRTSRGCAQAAETARLALSGDEADLDGRDAMSLVAAARKSLDVEREHDPRLAELADALASASYALADVAADIAAYATSLDADPARLAAVQERRAVLSGAHPQVRRHGGRRAGLVGQTAAARLLELEDDDSPARGAARTEAASWPTSSTRARRRPHAPPAERWQTTLAEQRQRPS